MQYIEFDLSKNEAEIKSVDGEVAKGNLGSVELQIINAPSGWTDSGKVWATFTKNGKEHSNLTTYVDGKFVTMIPNAIFVDDRSFGIFVYYVGGQNYVETRRVIDMPIADTGTASIEVVSEEEQTEVMKMLANMTTLYNTVTAAENDRYQKYYDAEGLTEKEIGSAGFKSRKELYEEAENARKTTFNDNEDRRNDTFVTNENDRYSTFKTNETIRQSNESVRQDNEELRQQGEADRYQMYYKAEGINKEEINSERFFSRNDLYRQREDQRDTAYNTAETYRMGKFNENEDKRNETLGKILVPGSETIVNKAENDDVGNKIRLTYAPKTKLDNLENKVNNLVAYGNVVHRAECDDEGNKIRYVYARKDEVQNNLNIVHDIISLEGDKEIDADSFEGSRIPYDALI